jgi:hypothetical protein
VRSTLSGPKLSKRVYLALKWGQASPLELIRWSLAERFGWTLADVDALSMADLAQFYQIEDGRAKAREDGRKNSQHIR